MNNILVDIRNKNKITQQDLADKIGVSLRTYQYWEKGKCEPSASNAVILACFLGTTVETIFNKKENNNGANSIAN